MWFLTFLIETYFSPTRLTPSMACSIGSSRSVYVATPIFMPSHGSASPAVAACAVISDDHGTAADTDATAPAWINRLREIRLIDQTPAKFGAPVFEFDSCRFYSSNRVKATFTLQGPRGGD